MLPMNIKMYNLSVENDTLTTFPALNGTLIKELRIKKGWKQAYLAYIVGISSYKLSRIENGKTRISHQLAILILEKLKL
ncbi:helix-turn-helix domain-containing protein [Arcicella lustrica]